MSPGRGLFQIGQGAIPDQELDVTVRPAEIRLRQFRIAFQGQGAFMDGLIVPLQGHWRVALFRYAKWLGDREIAWSRETRPSSA